MGSIYTMFLYHPKFFAHTRRLRTRESQGRPLSRFQEELLRSEREHPDLIQIHHWVVAKLQAGVPMSDPEQWFVHLLMNGWAPVIARQSLVTPVRAVLMTKAKYFQPLTELEQSVARWLNCGHHGLTSLALEKQKAGLELSPFEESFLVEIQRGLRPDEARELVLQRDFLLAA